MVDIANGTHIVKVKDKYYKPAWFDNFMYFVNIHDGNLYRSRPIYLQDRDYATLSDLKNYFQENEIEIFGSKSLI